jgi:hypothetical protein
MNEEEINLKFIGIINISNSREDAIKKYNQYLEKDNNKKSNLSVEDFTNYIDENYLTTEEIDSAIEKKKEEIFTIIPDIQKNQPDALPIVMNQILLNQITNAQKDKNKEFPDKWKKNYLDKKIKEIIEEYNTHIKKTKTEESSQVKSKTEGTEEEAEEQKAQEEEAKNRQETAKQAQDEADKTSQQKAENANTAHDIAMHKYKEDLTAAIETIHVHDNAYKDNVKKAFETLEAEVEKIQQKDTSENQREFEEYENHIKQLIEGCNNQPGTWKELNKYIISKMKEDKDTQTTLLIFSFSSESEQKAYMAGKPFDYRSDQFLLHHKTVNIEKEIEIDVEKDIKKKISDEKKALLSSERIIVCVFSAYDISEIDNTDKIVWTPYYISFEEDKPKEKDYFVLPLTVGGKEPNIIRTATQIIFKDIEKRPQEFTFATNIPEAEINTLRLSILDNSGSNKNLYFDIIPPRITIQKTDYKSLSQTVKTPFLKGIIFEKLSAEGINAEIYKVTYTLDLLKVAQNNETIIITVIHNSKKIEYPLLIKFKNDETEAEPATPAEPEPATPSVPKNNEAGDVGKQKVTNKTALELTHALVDISDFQLKNELENISAKIKDDISRDQKWASYSDVREIIKNVAKEKVKILRYTKYLIEEIDNNIREIRIIERYFKRITNITKDNLNTISNKLSITEEYVQEFIQKLLYYNQTVKNLEVHLKKRKQNLERINNDIRDLFLLVGKANKAENWEGKKILLEKIVKKIDYNEGLIQSIENDTYMHQEINKLIIEINNCISYIAWGDVPKTDINQKILDYLKKEHKIHWKKSSSYFFKEILDRIR